MGSGTGRTVWHLAHREGQARGGAGLHGTGVQGAEETGVKGTGLLVVGCRFRYIKFIDLRLKRIGIRT